MQNPLLAQEDLFDEFLDDEEGQQPTPPVQQPQPIQPVQQPPTQPAQPVQGEGLFDEFLPETQRVTVEAQENRIAPDLSPVEWVGQALWHAPGIVSDAGWGGVGSSTWDVVKDTLAILKPFGERASGEKTGIPTIADLARVGAESQMTKNPWEREGWEKYSPITWLAAIPGIPSKVAGKLYVELDEWLFGGNPQAGNETPIFDAVRDYYVNRYDFSKKETRDAFEQVLREDPVGVFTDFLAVASIGAGSAAGVAKTAQGASQISKIATASRLRNGRFTRLMDNATGATAKISNVVNKGFHVPLIPPPIRKRLPQGVKRRIEGSDRWKAPVGNQKTERFEVQSGLADILDPGVWALRAGIRGGKTTWDNIAAPHAKDVRPDLQDRMRQEGFTDDEGNIIVPATGQSESETVASIQARAYKNQEEHIVYQMKETVDRLEARTRELLDEMHESGDIEDAGQAMGDAYFQFKKDIAATVANMYEGIEGRLEFPMDLRAVYDTLMDLREQDADMARSRADKTPFANDPIIREAMSELEQLARLGTEPLDPKFAAEGSVIPDSETPRARPRILEEEGLLDALNGYGTRWRIASDVDGNHFHVSYHIIDLTEMRPNAHRLEDRPGQLSPIMKAQDMAGHWDSEASVKDTGQISKGTIIIDPNGNILSGNAQFQALAFIYANQPKTAREYQRAMYNAAPNYGLGAHYDDLLIGTLDDEGNILTSERILENPELIRKNKDITRPVLVRVLEDQDIDSEAFIEAANKTDPSIRSKTQQNSADLDRYAKSEDIIRISPDDRNGDPNTIRSEAERLFTETEDRTRFMNAIWRRVFNRPWGAAMSEALNSKTAPGIASIKSAIEDALPHFIRLEDSLTHMASLNLSGDMFTISELIGQAVREIIDVAEEAQSSGRSVAEALEDGSRVSEFIMRGGNQDDIRNIQRVVLRTIGNKAPLRDFIRQYKEAIFPSDNSGIRTDGTGVPLTRSQFIREIADSIVGDRSQRKTTEEINKLMTEVEKQVEHGASQVDPDLADQRRQVGDRIRAEQRRQDAADNDSLPEPYLYRHAEALRTRLFNWIEAHRRNPAEGRQVMWYERLYDALTEAMDDTLKANDPALTPTVNQARRFYAAGRDKLNSEFARAIVSAVGQGINPGTAEYGRLVRTVFSPNDTVSNIRHKYELLGGFDSDASQRVRRSFLQQMFDFARTAEGTEAAAQIERGEVPTGAVDNRFSPTGLGRFMQRFRRSAADYSDEVLVEILGQEVVDSLNNLSAITNSLGRMTQRTRGSQTAFLFENREVQGRFTRAMGTIGQALGGAALTAIQFGYGGALGSTIRAGGAWATGALIAGAAMFGVSTFNKLMSYLVRHGFGDRYLLQGFEFAILEDWLGQKSPNWDADEFGIRSESRPRQALKMEEQEDEEE